MSETGQVIKKTGNMVTIRMERKEACAKCRACIAGFTSTEMIINAQNTCRAELHDWVEIELDNKPFLSAVLIMYGIPLIALMAGSFAGYYGAGLMGYAGHEGLIGLLAGIIFTLFAYLTIHSQEKKFRNNKYQPQAVQIINPNVRNT